MFHMFVLSDNNNYEIVTKTRSIKTWTCILIKFVIHDRVHSFIQCGCWLASCLTFTLYKSTKFKLRKKTTGPMDK